MPTPLDERIDLLAADVRVRDEAQAERHLDATRTAQAAHQRGVLSAQRRDHPPWRLHLQIISHKACPRAQADELPQELDAEQAVTSLRIRFPVDQHLTSPQSGSGFLTPVAEVGRQPRVPVEQRDLDARECSLEFGHRQCRPSTSRRSSAPNGRAR